MATIHITFNEDNAEEAYAYERLTAIGRKNRSKLLKGMILKAVSQYGYLFEKEYAGALIAILQKEVVTQPSVQVVAAGQQAPVRRGKKRGPKPKNKSTDIKTTDNISNVMNEPEDNRPRLPGTTRSMNITEPVQAKPATNKNGSYYKRMGDYLDNDIYSQEEG